MKVSNVSGHSHAVYFFVPANFPYVRGKLKLAEDNSDTDLRTDDEEHTNGRKLRNRKTHRTVCDSWVDESSKMDLPKFPSGNSESSK